MTSINLPGFKHRNSKDVHLWRLQRKRRDEPVLDSDRGSHLYTPQTEN